MARLPLLRAAAALYASGLGVMLRNAGRAERRRGRRNSAGGRFAARAA